MKNQSFYDQLVKGFADAIAEIREKVVEEGYFGRVVTERAESHSQPETTVGLGVAVSITEWPKARAAEPNAGDHERDNGPEIDIDR
jgi:hypothetical protein